MRARIVAVAAVAMLLAACTPLASPTREHSRPLVVPQDLTWQYATTCMLEPCAAEHRLEQRSSSFNYVDAFERAQLWDYDNAVTLPCLEENGVTVPALTRARFFLPDQPPRNPCTAMADLPFDQLFALYRACPPIPDYLRDRHEP